MEATWLQGEKDRDFLSTPCLRASLLTRCDGIKSQTCRRTDSLDLGWHWRGLRFFLVFTHQLDNVSHPVSASSSFSCGMPLILIPITADEDEDAKTGGQICFASFFEKGSVRVFSEFWAPTLRWLASTPIIRRKLSRRKGVLESLCFDWFCAPNHSSRKTVGLKTTQLDYIRI